MTRQLGVSFGTRLTQPAHDPLAQLNNSLGGILRGGEAITALYDRVFHGPALVTVTFGDIVKYADATHVLYHHHGSIDDADALAAYQAAIRG
ncbi:hypothetical protein [Amycolatopsis sacchari]|uniref:Uncharacterized protein n=1 Tax=Amycolatopsis sacchari TaxID=115433 RepID=A0A1I3VTM8_9PSEU|nr:hypothetical protein [Amycolatopsis sacchari]SFJ97636.1 hypothetical protein SAMN05421835_111167 [Amycolatopsis sacchari]